MLDEPVKLKGRNLLVMGHKDTEGKLNDRKVHMLIPETPSVLQAREGIGQITLEMTHQPHDGSKTKNVGFAEHQPILEDSQGTALHQEVR